MPGANFPRIKNWVEEILTYEDLNREIDNILENFNTDGMAGYSVNQAQMQEQTDPGGVGSESLATSLSGEIERLRFVIARMIGDDYWYEAPERSLNELNEIVDTITSSNAQNRIASGQTTANSAQLNALDPAGTGTSVTLDATPTPFVYYINGQQYTVSADVSISGLTTAPSTNNTALVNNAALTGTQETKWLGQFGSTIPVDTMGAQITTLIGRVAAFKKGNEIFTAYVKSSTELTNAQRGFFYNSSLAPLPAETLSDNDVITLMRLTWVFINAAGTLQVTYVPPIVSAEQPGTASSNDYWYDLVAKTWKIYNGTSWSVAAVLPIGYAVQDATNTIAARTFDVFKNFSAENSIILEYADAGSVVSKNTEAQISVNGNSYAYGQGKLVWSMSTDLAAGETEQASTTYYFYVTDAGNTVITATAPVYQANRLGYYHPAEMYRAVGSIFNDAGQNFVASTLATIPEYGIDGEWLATNSIAVDKIKNLHNSRTFNYTDGSPVAFVVPANVSEIRWIAVGGGGGGGNGAGGHGGGGGAGGVVMFGHESVTPGETLNITVGAGGGSAVAGNASTIFRATGSVQLARAYGGASGATASGSGGAGGTGFPPMSGSGGAGGTTSAAGTIGGFSYTSPNSGGPGSGGSQAGGGGGGASASGSVAGNGGSGTGSPSRNGTAGTLGAGGGGGAGGPGGSDGTGGAGGNGFVKIMWIGPAA